MPRATLPTIPIIPQAAEAQGSFEDGARRALNTLRAAYSGLLASISGKTGRPIQTPTDLQRTLGIRSTLAWQVFRVGTTANPIRELDAIPGPTAMKRVVDAARKHGVSAAAIDELVNAVQTFEEFVREQAGTRKTFNSLVAALGEETDDGPDVQYRREAFHANSHIWGARVQMVIGSLLVFPGKTNELLWSANLMSKIGVQRMRTDVAFRIGGQATYDGSASIPTKPLDDGEYTPALLQQFSTSPLPPIDRVTVDGRTVLNLVPGPVGKAGSADFIFAGVGPESSWVEESGPAIKITTLLAAPTELLVQDMLIHTSMFDRLAPQAFLYLDMNKGPLLDWMNPPPHTRQVAKHKPVHLGMGAGAASVQEFPRYTKLLEFVCSKLGWNAADFHVYRCRVAYPILFGMYQMHFDLPEKGNW